MTNQSELFIQEFHPEAKTSIIFLHGGGSSGWMWRRVVDKLPEYHCLVVDLPEHGGSAWVKPFSMRFAAEKTAEIIHNRAHHGKAVVVGLSEGAQVAVQMLADCPDVMEAAMISSALLLPIPGGKMYSSRKLLSFLYQISIPPFRNNNWWIKLNMKYAAGIPEEYFDNFKRDFQNTTESQFINLMAANQTFRLPDGVELVEIPVLAVCGKHEYKAMRDSAELLTSRLKHGQFRMIDLGERSGMAAEHNWALVMPLAFATTLRNWLKGSALPEILHIPT